MGRGCCRQRQRTPGTEAGAQGLHRVAKNVCDQNVTHEWAGLWCLQPVARLGAVWRPLALNLPMERRGGTALALGCGRQPTPGGPMEKPTIRTKEVKLVHYIARKLCAGARSRNYDELVATGMLGLVEARNRYRDDGGASFRTLATIHIRGRIIDQMRRHRRWNGNGPVGPSKEARPEAVAVQPPTEEQIGLVEPQRSLESVFTRRELLAKLRAAMGELQGKEREVIKLRYLEGLETDEIARRWGCTRRTVNCLCKHSRERLRRLMQIGHQEAAELGL